MEFKHRYHGSSQVENSNSSTSIQFEPDTLRDPTFFVADLGQSLLFREAVSALHDVVISDLRAVPKDRQAYFEWLAENESAMLAEFVGQKANVEARLKQVRSELNEINKASTKLMAPYYKAQREYFSYLYTADYDAWFVLDPVITVHPDEVFFECFSNDESTYGRLSCGYGVFENISEKSFGTTNIDYSDSLYNEFQKIRDYKQSRFCIDPGGFEVSTTNEDSYTEQKIDLPDSWVRGFLQVSSAMSLPMTRFTLHPMDVHNICFLLRRQKETHGPRSIRFELNPGEPVTMVFEPWNKKLVCRRSVYSGDEAQEIRIWGRRRLLTLERLIPIASEFSVCLLGTGMPSFFIAQMGDMSFTLGLSGWTANDWSKMGNFDLMAPRATVDDVTMQRVFAGLKQSWFSDADSLAQQLQLDRALVRGSLSLYTQAGRVIYDLAKGVYRVRELSQEPLPMDQLRYQNEREAKADKFVTAKLAKLGHVEYRDGYCFLDGSVRDNAVNFTPSIVIDEDESMVEANCQCHFYVHNKLFKGPCEHMLALRRQFELEKQLQPPMSEMG